MRINLLITAVTVFAVASANIGQAAVSVPFVPAGLSFGDTYQIAFFTEGTRDATSIDIDDYNAFVTDEAERSGAITENWGIQWFALASTSTIDARDNALVSGPLYNLGGTLLRTGFDDLWGGRGLFSANFPSGSDQFGVVLTSDFQFWAGFNAFGEAYDTVLGDPEIEAGRYLIIDGLIIDGLQGVSIVPYDGGIFPNTTSLPLIVFSEVLTVVPEPTAALFLCGSGALAYLRRRRR